MALWRWFVSGVALVVCLSFSLPALAIEYGGLGGKPAHPNAADPRTESWFILKADPGQVLQDELLVVNNTSEQKEVVLYPADSLAASGGGFALKQQMDTMQEIGSWVTLSTTSLTLAPFEKKSVPFTLTVPANATPGEHTGGIIVQEKAAPVQGENGMTLALRMGVRIYLTLSGEITKQITFDALEAKVEDSLVTFVLPVKNTGNASVDITEGELTVKNVTTGEVVQRYSLQGFQVLQASPFLFSAEWQRPPAGGEYTVEGFATYVDAAGQTQRITTSAPLSLPSLVPAAPVAPVAAAGAWSATDSVFVAGGGVIGLLVGTLAGIFIGWRMRKPVASAAKKRAKK